MNRLPAVLAYRETLIHFLGNRCDICGNEDRLEIHHLDKNPNNNHPSNLQLLCSTHHHREGRPTSKTGTLVKRQSSQRTSKGEKIYSKYWIYVPTGVAEDKAFPFKPGQKLLITITESKRVMLELA